MDKKYQIFISSTFIDLRDERRRVTEAILNLGHIPVGMELFQAGDDSQWSYIKQSIDEADYYVVIIGERYGSEVDGKSYTQMEYEYALEKGVPVAAFLLSPEARLKWPSSKVEHEKRGKVDDFRSLCQNKLVQYWDDEKDLALKVSTALTHLFRSKPRVGWVRADSVPSGKVLDELAILSDEKRRLQAQVDELTAENSGLGPDERIRLEELFKTDADEFVRAPLPVPQNMLTVFMELHRPLSVGQNEKAIMKTLRNLFGLPGDANFDISDLMAELCRLHLAQFEMVQGLGKLYSLTDYGKDIALLVPKWETERKD